jgi:hypothetical protein
MGARWEPASDAGGGGLAGAAPPSRHVLASGQTRAAVESLGLDVTGYRRSRDPDVSVAFEAQVDRMMATMAGAEIALDARDAVDELRPDVAIVDCMLPAALAALGQRPRRPSRSCTSCMGWRGHR